jgi:hypothetical protein
MDRMSFDELLKCKKFKVLEPSTVEMEGNDRVGILLILNKNPITGEAKNWTHWTGSILGQETSKFFGPTTIQVATGVLVAIKYAAINQRKGAMYSEALESEFVVETCRPFMGEIISAPMPWSPESTQFTALQVKHEGKKTTEAVPEIIKNVLEINATGKVKGNDDSTSSEEEEESPVGSPEISAAKELMKLTGTF